MKNLIEGLSESSSFVARCIVGLGVALLSLAMLSGCVTDADVVSDNLSKAADQFEINRRIVAVNGITNDYLLEVTGKCSITDADRQLEVTCKLENGTYVKHFVGLSDNTTYFAEQTNGTEADSDQYRVIFKPESIIPNVDRP